MEPTRIYVKPLLALMQSMPGVVKGMAHITGGGITENVPRILRDELTARIEASSWTLPPLFQWLQQAGNVDAQEMYRVFNCGIGMVVVVAADVADAVAAQLSAAGETVYRIGTIDSRKDGEAQTIVA
ncbi:Phosphoribosylformylglycinamidine cyclo-ligase [bioreactor metagenome]